MASLLSVAIENKRFDSGKVLLRDLSLAIAEREFVTLIAPSGAGKSTLLRIIAGTDDDFIGKISLKGKCLEGPSRDIQIVPQDSLLVPWKTVEENLALAVRNPSEEVSKERIRNLLEQFGLFKRRKSWPKELSGGELGRVAIIRALVCPPSVLLLDEPFRSLDVLNRTLLHALLGGLRGRIPVTVMASHRITDSVLASDRILLMGSDPMRLLGEVSIELRRPRQADAPEFQEVCRDVRRSLLEATTPED